MIACAVALAINAGLSAALDEQQRHGGLDLSYARGGLASYFLFQIIFSFSYTPLQAVVATEALETTTRAKGLAASGIIVSAMGFINQFAGPIALDNIGYKYIFVFVGWDCFEALIWYLFAYVSPCHGLKERLSARLCLLTYHSSSVEAQGRTLEQLEWVYSQPNPVKASLVVDKVVVQVDGTVTEKIVGDVA